MPKKRSKNAKKTKAEEKKTKKKPVAEKSPEPPFSEENLEEIEEIEEILEEQEIELDPNGTPGTKNTRVTMKQVKLVINKKLATPSGKPSHALRWNLFLLSKKPDHIPRPRNLKQLIEKRLVEKSEADTLRLTETGEELAKVLDHYYSIPPKDRAEKILGVE